MPILEMIPREYWIKLYQELKAVYPDLVAEKGKLENKKRERRSGEFDEAIKRKRREIERKSRNQPEAKDKKSAYNKKYWAKRKKQKNIN